MTKSPKPLSEALLYTSGNGRITCGKVRCAGMTAASGGGYDCSGSRVVRLSKRDAAELLALGIVPKCESCGLEEAHAC